MVMNKKGFLKILEAIVAILIVLGFIVAIIPEKPAQQAKLPPDLEQTTNSILKELQETPEFRSCVLGGSSTYSEIRGSEAECVYNFIKFITEPRVLHPWDYATRVCTVDSRGEDTPPQCTFYAEGENGDGTAGEITEQITQFATRVGKNIYIRSITITVEDVLGAGGAGDSSRDVAEDEDDASESDIRPGVQRIITIFAWSKR